MSVRYCDYLDVDPTCFDAVVVGAGLAGSIVSRELAERAGLRVLVIEKRAFIGGNLRDEVDEAGIRVHKYGPHVFHSDNPRVVAYMQRFDAWRVFGHIVLSNWYGTYLPVPFNESSMKVAFGEEKARYLSKKLAGAYGSGAEVPMSELLNSSDEDIAELAAFIYENVFSYYTEKQWGVPVDEVDARIIDRVPVRISDDDRYFTDNFQGVPESGYTALFESILDHENIQVCLNTEAESAFELIFESDAALAPLSGIKLKGRLLTGPIVHTGPLDELFLARFGRLPYRSTRFEFETLDKESCLPSATVNFTVTEDFTRMTEFKKLTGQKSDVTTVVREYPVAYEDPQTQIPCYPIINDGNIRHYERYRALTDTLPNFYPLGRLAEYRYYDMDVVVERAFALADILCDDKQ